MRPITLKIKGINSFVEEQVIDFSELTQDGLFGIFGKTGSGKSTILDAILLALYGDVARNTKGFVNTTTKTGTVSFEFSILQNDYQTYRIERTFKATETGFSNTKSKIINVATNEVIEDSKKNVDKKCIQIIGLGKDDFLRTVIIPQNKFSEFLNLTGKARRDMLERIFKLEKYGDKLTNTINKRKRIIEADLNTIAGELNVLGDISKEICEELEKELNETKTSLQHRTKTRLELSEKYKKLEKIWKLQDEIKISNDNIALLEKQRSQIEIYEKEIELYDKANLVKPFLDGKNSAVLAYDKEKANFEKIEKDLEALKQNEKTINDTFSNAEEENKKIPNLSEQKSELNTALENENKIKTLIQDIARIEGEITKLKAEKSEVEKMKDEKETTELTLQNKIKDLEAELTTLTIAPEYRENITNGVFGSKDLAKLKKEKDSINSKIKDLEEVVKNLEVEQQDLNNKIGNLQLEDTKPNANVTTLEETKGKLKTTQEDKRKYELNNLATTLQKSCKEGDNCPVCGANIISLPALTHDETAVDFDKIIEGLELDITNLEQEIQDEKDNKVKAKNDLELKANEVKTKLDLNATKLKDLSEQKDEVDTNYNQKNTEIEAIKAETKVEDFKKASDDIKAKDSKKTSIENEITTSRNSLNDITKEMKEYDNNIAKIDVEVAGHESTKISNTQQKETLSKDLEDKFGKDYDIAGQLKVLEDSINTITKNYEDAKTGKENYDKEVQDKEKDFVASKASLETENANKTLRTNEFNDKMNEHGFTDEKELAVANADEKETQVKKSNITDFYENLTKQKGVLESAQEKLGSDKLTQEEWEQLLQDNQVNELEIKRLTSLVGEFGEKFKNATENLAKHEVVMAKKAVVTVEYDKITIISKLFEGKKFVEYVASRRLKQVSIGASEKLKDITGGEYALETDAEGQFIINHLSQGGARRSPSTLSGGETFMISLALSLALSEQIQLKTTAPLELFFLDEGFGTLDEDLTDVVMNCLEGLPNEKMKIGLISHVESIKARVPRKLVVQPAKSGDGSKVNFELT